MRTAARLIRCAVAAALVAVANAEQRGLTVDGVADIPVFSALHHFTPTQGTLQMWVRGTGRYSGQSYPYYFAYEHDVTAGTRPDQLEVSEYTRQAKSSNSPNFHVMGSFDTTSQAHNLCGPATVIPDIREWTQITVTWKQEEPDVTDAHTYINGQLVHRAWVHSQWHDPGGGTFALGGRTRRSHPGHVTVDEVRLKRVAIDGHQVRSDYRRMAVGKQPLARDASTTFFAHFDRSTRPDYAAGDGSAGFGTGSQGVLGEGYPFAPERLPTAVMVAPTLHTAPVIDGNLDDSVWRNLPWSPAFVTLAGTEAKSVNRFKIAHDDTNLYIALSFSVRDPAKLVARHSRDIRDGKLWRDDCAEVFINPTPSDKLNYYHFIVNSKGSRYDALGMGPGWNANWVVSSEAGPGVWRMEMLLPLSAFERGSFRKGEVWRINAAREDRVDHEVSAWSPTFEDDLHATDRFWRAGLWRAHESRCRDSRGAPETRACPSAKRPADTGPNRGTRFPNGWPGSGQGPGTAHRG